jgi:uncharacterized protein
VALSRPVPDPLVDLIARRLQALARPDPAVIAELERRGVIVECLTTDAAVRRYGQLDERRTAAALHLTC